MVSVRIQIQLIADDFSFDADFFTETLPATPQIGEQILTRKVREKLTDYHAAFAAENKSRNEYLCFGDLGLSFVSKIAYSDDGILICLSHNPTLIPAYIYPGSSEQPTATWTAMAAVPHIGDRISRQTSDSGSVAEFVQEIFWTAGSILAIKTSASPIYTGVEIRNQVDANVMNSINAYIENSSIDVNIDRTVDVNVKRFDHGYIYVKSENDRY